MLESIKEELKLFEDEFSSTNYRGSNTEFKFIEGNPDSKVLLSVPHCLKHTREGDLIGEEIFTGAVGKEIAKLTNSPIIYSASCLSDPNHDEEDESAYKQKMITILHRGIIKYVLDFHGMADMDNDICIVTNNGENINNTDIDLKLANILGRHFKVVIDEPFDAHKDTTIVTWANTNFFVQTLQIKMAKRIRNLEGNQLAQFVADLVEFINKI